MLRKITIMIFLILTVVWFTNSDSIQPAREFIQNNIYVWSEMQEEKLPIYCVDTQKKQIALTFDTAWGNEDIPQILKILKQENVKATFFFCGDWISKYPADIKTIYEEGHDIASHGDHHAPPHRSDQGNVSVSGCDHRRVRSGRRQGRGDQDAGGCAGRGRQRGLHQLFHHIFPRGRRLWREAHAQEPRGHSGAEAGCGSRRLYQPRAESAVPADGGHQPGACRSGICAEDGL